MTTPVSPPKRPKHLMDPNNLQRPSPHDATSLTQVQKWVMSTLAVTTILHLAAGLVLAAYFTDEDRLDARIGLLVIGGAFGVVAIASGLAIHGARILSWWLLLGWIPALVGAWLMFGR
jgi:hypothetical protein